MIIYVIYNNLLINFRVIQLTPHAEPLRGLVGRCLRQRLLTIEAKTRMLDGEMSAAVDWVAKIHLHLNTFVSQEIFDKYIFLIIFFLAIFFKVLPIFCQYSSQHWRQNWRALPRPMLGCLLTTSPGRVTCLQNCCYRPRPRQPLVCLDINPRMCFLTRPGQCQ